MRIHNSRKLIKKLRFNYFQRPLEMKPLGFWYAIGDSWHEWCKSEQPNWIGKYNYQLEVDETKLLIVGRDMSMEQFMKRYGKLPEWHTHKAPKWIEEHSKWVDWKKIAEEYSGIEIPTYSWEHRRKYLWYYGWDVASGCIWKEDALKSIKLVGAKHGIRLRRVLRQKSRSKQKENREEAGSGRVPVGS